MSTVSDSVEQQRAAADALLDDMDELEEGSMRESFRSLGGEATALEIEEVSDLEEEEEPGNLRQHPNSDLQGAAAAEPSSPPAAQKLPPVDLKVYNKSRKALQLLGASVEEVMQTLSPAAVMQREEESAPGNEDDCQGITDGGEEEEAGEEEAGDSDFVLEDVDAEETSAAPHKAQRTCWQSQVVLSTVRERTHAASWCTAMQWRCGMQWCFKYASTVIFSFLWF